MTSFLRKLRWLTRRRRKEDELNEELRFHLEEEAEQRQAEGLAPEQAKWAARRDLGNVTMLREETRTAWGWTMLEQFGQDLRYAFRTMASNRLFTLLAVGSLALGIGANTAIYSFMDSILLRALPVSDPASLVLLNWHRQTATKGGPSSVIHGMDGYHISRSQVGHHRAHLPLPRFRAFPKETARYSPPSSPFTRPELLNVSVKGQADIADGEYVSGDYFGGLGVSTCRGEDNYP